MCCIETTKHVLKLLSPSGSSQIQVILYQCYCNMLTCTS